MIGRACQCRRLDARQRRRAGGERVRFRLRQAIDASPKSKATWSLEQGCLHCRLGVGLGMFRQPPAAKSASCLHLSRRALPFTFGNRYEEGRHDWYGVHSTPYQQRSGMGSAIEFGLAAAQQRHNIPRLAPPAINKLLDMFVHKAQYNCIITYLLV
jgi:hypothetical protein